MSLKTILENNKNVNCKTFELNKLKSNFPQYFDKNGKFDFDKFKNALDCEDVEYSDEPFSTKESYSLSFVGKKFAQIQCGQDTTTVITPDLEHNNKPENINSENIYIKGDNLDAIKHLLKSYKGAIKCIYIDPPYNTGSDDFAYPDNFKYDISTLKKIGLSQEEAERVERLYGKSTHSAWLTFMMPRLLLAKELLSDDGVIFISIDDNECDNLKLLCDREIFGEENFVNRIAVKMSEATSVKMSHQWSRFPKLKEYLLFYKNNNFKKFLEIDKYKQEKWDKENSIFLENMSYQKRQQLIKYQSKNEYTLEDIEDINTLLKDVRTRSLDDKIKELNLDGNDAANWMFDNSYRIIKTVGAGAYMSVVKDLAVIPNQEIAAQVSKQNILFFYITDFNRNAADPRFRVIFADENIYKNPCDFWQDIKTSGGIAEEGGVKYPNGKKPLKVIERIVKMTSGNDDIVLDFFSGSATTAHAVMNLNAKNNQKRKFIMVQSVEKIEPNTSEKKEYIKYLEKENIPPVITEIGIERIKRSAKRIKQETDADIDYGFKIYELNNPSQDTLDKIESFDESLNQLYPADFRDYYKFNNVAGEDTILQTWKVKDGYGFTAKHEEIYLNDMLAYSVGKTLYLINPSKEDFMKPLIEKFETELSKINKVVVFGYSYTFTQMQSLYVNIKNYNDAKNGIKTNITVEVRY